ncbi:hypothetical protein S7335_1138 [Synechococcus sp. PCC 7335]|uniref:hypothetical protein n=1 Tax=Synechococcus sp. (strain ATCC 29403 / PCC 7335) TaxID=91464 RepID=UPI00017EB57B|nr:hypothetical protein [Synechococcus sp. PCC 7335]EDX82434.1 hypothetical protein S7335_1138 [Synechococcus sp. PCC 7335]
MQSFTKDSLLTLNSEQLQPIPEGLVPGVLRANYRTREVFFYRDNGRKYYTSWEYRSWADRVCFAEIDYNQSKEAANVGGCAYRILFVDELPSPSELAEEAQEHKKGMRYLCGVTVVFLVFIWLVLLPWEKKLQSEPSEWIERGYQQEVLSE